MFELDNDGFRVTYTVARPLTVIDPFPKKIINIMKYDYVTENSIYTVLCKRNIYFLMYIIFLLRELIVLWGSTTVYVTAFEKIVPFCYNDVYNDKHINILKLK